MKQLSARKKLSFMAVNEAGAILVVALMMLTVLVAAVAVCEAVFGDGGDNGRRYLKTLHRMELVRQAMLGNPVPDYSRGRGCAGGFVGDYGKPDDMTPFAEGSNFTGILLDARNVPEEWAKWAFGTVCRNWAGYRGDRYLIHPPDEGGGGTSCVEILRDGWGNEILTEFVADTEGHYSAVKIASFGSDGKAGGIGDFREDIVFAYYWQRSLFLTVFVDAADTTLPDNTDIEMDVRIVYPDKGKNRTVTQTGTITIIDRQGMGVFDFFFLLPVGCRRVDVLTKTDCTSYGGPEKDTLIYTGAIQIPAETAKPGWSGPPASPDADFASIKCPL